MKKHSILFIGLDTHKDSIAVAYATDSQTEPVTYLVSTTLLKDPKAVKLRYC